MKKQEKQTESLFETRLNRHFEELKWLYFELYPGCEQEFAKLCTDLEDFSGQRKAPLKKLDREREQHPDWYRSSGLLGMMMYADAFAGTLQGVRDRLDYIASCNVNYLHLMPLLQSPSGRSDGGYAVSDFRTVQPELGKMEDLEALADDCRSRGISICLDFVMNHTSEDHAWAKRARRGEKEYMDRYYFYDNYDLPSQFEQTVPQVFPTTAPGNFTWLEDMGKFVMTTFYPYQWDLNYWNPAVLTEMVCNLLYLANRGIDIIRIDAVPYIWKQLGTNCRNLPQVHSIVRILRMITEIVCPGVILLGEVVMEPSRVVPYFGTVEKPECHLLYNVTTMATTWHTVATRDVRLLRRQLDLVNGLPKKYVFLNYLRCHDDIGWGLDYDWLRQFGIEEVPHKKFLNDYLTGRFPDSVGRGELYNSDPASGDARLCGTTASLCGLEKALYEQDEQATRRAVRYVITLHAFMLIQSGVPVLYSGDEIGQLNDYGYHQDPEKQADSRYLHRGAFRWDLKDRIEQPGTSQQMIFSALDVLEKFRASHAVFGSQADVRTLDTGDDAVLALERRTGEEKLLAFFNFSESDKTVWPREDGEYTDVLTGEKRTVYGLTVPAYGMYWLVREN